MKYKNKNGIELNFTGKDSLSILVKEVVNEAIKKLNDVDGAQRIQETVNFLKENFNIDKEI